MRARFTRHVALALAAAATGLGIGAVVLAGTPVATAQGYVPCEQWQAMHPGWPCIDTPTVPPGGPTHGVHPAATTFPNTGRALSAR
ncbi:hypothetical protein NS506_03791 [Nocardia seriolae]|uniref:Uncharacterized protein n=1 Tax=Nocardia seriolae TaxID=37332 RepID=A0ABC9Z756_9NOCA|nr:hypothetical protein NS506_03791 [Nocardia seriolae]GEM28902.1 hypothetical protein NS2_71410 [Nocardia seriolae NBRC 15557]BEK89377.1 hypothetical protein NSERKGN1266_53280 [Nocardia seriolae]BEK95006.1 hypothetical protein NSER024013_29120 [Nocardia seriolae]GAM51431.1 hypothetical protein NS07_v2contig00258-0003 [Nocardia seriolae]